MGVIEGILNWRVVDGDTSTSGQPSEAELAALAGDGVGVIVNLGPHDNKGALADEPGEVAGLGMEYVYIPVDFDAPTEDDYAAFGAALDARAGQRVHVHCIYNARVSAFFYRRAVDAGAGVDAAQARMDGIWRPGGVWAEFIGKPEDAAEPNRYKGYDY